MKKSLIITVGTVLLANIPAHAIDAKYRQKLASSGCTQMSEMQGCDINKTKAENTKAGFITYTIQGDRRLKGEDYWSDTDAKTKGPINKKK